MCLGIKAAPALPLERSRDTCGGIQMDANIAALHVAFVEAYFIEVVERRLIECPKLPFHVLIILITSVDVELASERIAI